MRRATVLGVAMLTTLLPSCAHAQPPTPNIATASTVAEPGNEMTEFDRAAQRSAALLYGMSYEGIYEFRCTATAFEREGTKVRFVSSSHCVIDDEESEKLRKSVPESGYDWYLNYDRGNNKTMMRASLVGLGYRKESDDYAVFEVELPEDVPLVPLADNDPETGEQLVNFASPNGFGIQFFKGHVSMKVSDRPIAGGSSNWRKAMMIQMAADHGSSGSAVISLKQRAIAGFLVAGVGAAGTFAMPVSAFKKFWEDVQYGRYPYFTSPLPPKRAPHAPKGFRPAQKKSQPADASSDASAPPKDDSGKQ